MLIPADQDEPIIQKAIYLPLLIKVLNRDLEAIKQSQLKLKGPYIKLVTQALHAIQRDSYENKKYMKRNNIKVERMKSEGDYTNYLLIYKGYQQFDKYSNPVLKRRSEELLEEYMLNIKAPTGWE